ncbi:C40 family peptidase [uncultured Actinomyces sp.]|uniref:C40 family peptidase n=1 Tax=uncultured Actinomyces sp. TaxID=249061 RepID=UPI0028D05848|nr:C40 family peptidase [uncultured Actinomyces sp.]
MRQRGTIRTALTVFAASALLILPQMAQAAPSEEEIAAAKAAEEAASMSVAEIEVKLAEVNATAATATQNAQIAGEDLNEAQIALNAATATANKASADANAAEAAFQEGKQQIASVAQATYRNGGGSLDAIAPYLDADGLRGVETKKVGINSFSSSAEAKMQNVAALEQVAKVTRDAANTALDNQKKATDEVQARTDAANKAATDAQTQANIVAAQRDAYVKELATKQNTTVDLINQREASLAAERTAAERAAAEQASAAVAAADSQRRADTPAPAADATPEAPASSPAPDASAAPAEEAPAPTPAEEAPAPAPAEEAPAPAPAEEEPAPAYEEPVYEEPDDEEPSYSYGGASTAIATAMTYLGVPYVWGGESYGGVDCSGLTMLAWESAGVDLPHLSRAQYGYGTHVSLGDMEAGDLIFWSSDGTQSGIYHVALYLGDGEMIEAPTFGVPVRVTGVYSWGSLMPYAVRL